MSDAQHLTFAEFWEGPENPYRRLVSGNEKNDAYFYGKAAHYFSLQIQDSLLSVLADAIELSDRAQNTGAFNFLRFGAARRLDMLWHAYRNILFVSHTERKDPLSIDESRELMRDLNVIYVNVRSTLDNFCSALLHEFAPEKTDISPWQVDLFKDVIVDDSRFKPLHATLVQHAAWYADVMKRRNPSAHRIPLYIPSQIVTKAEAERYRAIQKEHWESTHQLQFDKADRVLSQLQGVGTFVPIFMHDPTEGPIQIYPTVPDDIGHVIALFKAVAHYWESKASNQ